MPAPKGNGNAAKHGKSLITRALPYLINRVKDAATPEADLSPVERTLRQWREQAIRDQGGLDQWPVTKLEVLDTALGSLVILRSLDHYLFKLAENGGLINKRSRRLFSIVTDRQRVADSLVKQLQTVGLERKSRMVKDIAALFAESYQEPPSEPHDPSSGEPA